MADPTPPTDPKDGPGPTGPSGTSGHDPALGPGAIEFLTLGLSIAVTLVAVTALGYLVDRWLGTGPWFTLVGVALGITTAVLMTVSRVRKYL